MPARPHRTRCAALTPGQLPALAGHVADPALASLVESAPASWRAAQEQWGLCGVAVLGERATPRAAALVCPALHLPHGHPLQDFGRSPDSAQLVALAVGDAEAEGDARLLVQQLSRRLVRQAAALEACGSTSFADCRRPAVQVLAATGFQQVDQGHGGQLVRMRLDLGTTVRWPDLAPAWELVRGLVPGPYRPAEPTGRDACPERLAARPPR